MKAIWENTVVAESTETLVVESNHYFPPIRRMARDAEPLSLA